MSSSVLVTGATGHLGTYVARALLNRPDTRVVALVRADDDAHLAKRLAKLRARVGVEDDRLTAVRGDVTEPGLGMAELPDVDSIVHSAASIRFDVPAEEIAVQNVQGTLHVLDVARRLADAGRLDRLDYVGTCYIAGSRRGRVYEHECDVGQGFRNTYEQSKCRAETVVRVAQSGGLPVAIHRPSIIVGEQQTGATRAFNVIYGPLRSYIKGGWTLVPGNPDALIDLVPVDWVAAAIARLQGDPASIGGCYHLAVGDKAPTMLQMMSWIQEASGARPLRYMDQDFYFRWIRPWLSPFFWTKRGKMIERGAMAYMPYFKGNPLFDTTQASALLADLPPPSVEDYLTAVVRFAMEQDFGRKPGATGRD
ncbi:MAG: SDR family oxidoreductase [Alphaproteobacteria bacterium]|nr:SDR family oxidoreductase [Alphaproteobacteria bacterium]